MNKFQVLIGVVALSFVSIAQADDSQSNSQAHQDRMKNRQEKIQARIEKHCNGDQKCEADIHAKIDEKRQQVKAEIQKDCPSGEMECKKQVIQKMREDFKAKREEHKQSSSVKAS